MRNQIINILGISINKENQAMVDIEMTIKKENQEKEEIVVKTFTRSEWRKVRNEGYFND